MNDKLTAAYGMMQQGEVPALAEFVSELKALPRTKEGIFDLRIYDEDIYEAAAYVYPVYCAYETVCNKKEGYIDLMEQMREWKKMTDEAYNLKNAAAFLQILVNTIAVMSPEIYEYYRELTDMFRDGVKRVIGTYYRNGSFQDGEVSAEQISDPLSGVIKRACSLDLLLAEKYEEYCA